MHGPLPARRLIRFGVFELDTDALELRKRGVKVKLQDQPFRVLQLLLEKPGRVVTRDDLRARVWPADTFVEFDQGLYSAVARLRDALGDSSESPLFVETVARHGYRFIAPLAEGPPPGDDPGTPAAVPRPGERLAGFAVGGAAALAGAVLVLGVTLAFDVGGAREWLHRRTLLPVRSLAVIPLANLSGDPEHDFLSQGVTDQLTADLAELGDLRVISRTSVQRYKDTAKPLAQVGEELGVDAVVQGTVERIQGRVRVRVQLVRVPAGNRLWAQTYDREFEDALLIQSEAARDIAREIRLGLTTQQERRLAAVRHVDAEAYEACLKGLFFSNKRNARDFERAIEHFERAIDRDPGYARAYAGLSEALVGQLYTGTPSDRVRARATWAARKAVELDPLSPDAHTSLAVVRELYEWDWPGAEREYRHALELNPSSAGAHQGYSVLLAMRGRFDEAAAEARRAQDLDPVSPFVRTTFCWVLTLARRYDQAIQKCRQALELDADFIHAHGNLIDIYVAMGLGREAIAEFDKVAALVGSSPARTAAVNEGFARAGLEGYHRAMLDWELRSPPERVSAFHVATLYSQLGETGRSLEWLQKAFEERSPRMEELKVAPALDGVRSDPRFGELLRRVGL